MQATRIPYAQTKRFTNLVTDYIAGDAELLPFFGERPTLDGFRKQIAKRHAFSPAMRQILVTRISAQYQSIKCDAEAAAALQKRIQQLNNPKTFTVTTGHQLCLFTGPLYTVYKILHVIRLAEELSKGIDGITVLPIFWMATEDHDFEEVNHVRYHGHKLVWHESIGNAVGRMPTHAIKPVLDDLQNRLPQGMHAEALLADLQEAYLNQDNLANATRALVHKWFGAYGIICIDGDDPALKRCMIPAFSKELHEQCSFSAVSATNKALAQRYPVQVSPREINLFYLHEGMRSRIVQTGERYEALSGQASWVADELMTELNNHPERFSPNVLLRPLYQETILPNLGYIGGGGEVAYWAQLKKMFETFEVPFPIVMLRQSVQLIPNRITRKLQKLALEPEALFENYHTLAKQLVQTKTGLHLNLDATRTGIEDLYAALQELAKQVDPTLQRHVDAQKTRTLNGIDITEKKLFRAAKKSEADILRMLQECMDVVLPGGALQERHDNIIPHLLDFGPNLFDEILKAIDPLHEAFISLSEA